CESRTHLALIRCDCASQAHGILTSHHGLRNFLELAVTRVGMAIKEQPFASAHPKNCGGAAFQGPVDHAGRLQVFVRSEEHTSALQSHSDLVCRLLLEK